jgi:hypothetical protein
MIVDSLKRGWKMIEFRTWIESYEDQNLDLISFSGVIHPILKQRMENELGKKKKEIAKELASVLFSAFKGATRRAEESQIVWKFPLSNSPVNFKGFRLVMGNFIVAYKLPAENDNRFKISHPQMEEDKFLREKEVDMIKFLNDTALSEDNIQPLIEKLVKKYYDLYKNEGNESEEADNLLWTHSVTSNGGTRKLGSVQFLIQ